jgi:hypothetical protein
MDGFLKPSTLPWQRTAAGEGFAGVLGGGER